ncbi:MULTISPECIES: hypothetical protein [Proteiniphilum]|uniref:hypothetical protein n=1 Tax=Proteiniphilum TaxID=294702 RepID=UPI000364C6B3|nr:MULTISPECIES: hypothetical protein [Proteiniphilum]MDY9918417.1 hypothetical protein [Proteiniphilum sp.]SFL04409.1 hypothetical protein SAMN05216357_11184 [Porphyromonadaceae bacterium KH3CP3RA]
MKRIHSAYLSIIIALLLNTISCSKKFEDCNESLYLKNNSQSSIYYATTLKDGFLNYDPSNPTYASDYKIGVGQTQKVRIGITLSCWEQVIESADGYLYIYIYDAETLESEGWDNTKNKPLKKYNLTAKNLSQMKWTVVYP